MIKEHGVYAKEFESVDTKLYSYINSEGLFSKLMSEGMTTIIESGTITSDETESKDVIEFFADHVSKVNKMMKALGAKEKIDLDVFTAEMAMQLMNGTIESMSESESRNSRSMIYRVFKRE